MRLLSHPLTERTPAYRDNPSPRIEATKTVAADGNRSYSITFGNHTGTHLDAPAHFHQEGRPLGGLALDDLLFRHPALVDIPAGDDTLIEIDDFEPWLDRLAEADLLLVRTGYGALCRDSDPARYRHRGPGFAGPAAAWLRRRLPQLRALGMDFISAAAPAHPEAGRAFHLAALDEGRVRGRPSVSAPDAGRAVLLIEDMRLDPSLTDSDLGRVLVAPLWLSELDGAPVTVVAGL